MRRRHDDADIKKLHHSAIWISLARPSLQTHMALVFFLPTAAFAPAMRANFASVRAAVTMNEAPAGLAAVDELPTMYRARWAGVDESLDDALAPVGGFSPSAEALEAEAADDAGETCITTSEGDVACGAASFDSVDGGLTCVEVDDKWVCA